MGLAHKSVSDCWNLGNVSGRTKSVGGIASAITYRQGAGNDVAIERYFNAGRHRCINRWIGAPERRL